MYSAEVSQFVANRSQGRGRGQMLLWGRGQRCRTSYKYTTYERLRSSIKFINTKKSVYLTATN